MRSLRYNRTRVTQDFFEFELSRDLLFAGKAGGLYPLGSDDEEFFLFGSHDIDWFEWDESEELHGRAVILETCDACHRSGVRGVISYSRERFGPQGQGQPVLAVTTPDLEAQETIAWKEKHESWRTLWRLWQEMN